MKELRAKTVEFFFGKFATVAPALAPVNFDMEARVFEKVNAVHRTIAAGVQSVLDCLASGFQAFGERLGLLQMLRQIDRHIQARHHIEAARNDLARLALNVELHPYRMGDNVFDLRPLRANVAYEGEAAHLRVKHLRREAFRG